jgi:hypothetical protein
MRGNGSLSCHGGEDGVFRPVKRNKERIALGVDLPAAVRTESFSKQLAVVAEQTGIVAPELPDKLGRPLDVGEKKGDCPLWPFGAHGRQIVAPRSLVEKARNHRLTKIERAVNVARRPSRRSAPT